jgi:hypothetical protein
MPRESRPFRQPSSNPQRVWRGAFRLQPGMLFRNPILRWGIGWSPEFWSGAIVLAAFSGVGLTLLVAPPAVPEGV